MGGRDNPGIGGRLISGMVGAITPESSGWTLRYPLGPIQPVRSSVNARRPTKPQLRAAPIGRYQCFGAGLVIFFADGGSCSFSGGFKLSTVLSGFTRQAGKWTETVVP